jgi:hypothetical protein
VRRLAAIAGLVALGAGGAMVLAAAALDPKKPGAGACVGSPLELARRDLKRQVNPMNTAEEIAATIEFMEPQAPLYPCAEQLWAISPPDESGTARMKFETRASQKDLVDFYSAAMRPHGRVDAELGKPVQTVFIESGGDFVAVHVHPPENGSVQVFIEKEGKGGEARGVARGPGDGAQGTGEEKPVGQLAPSLRIVHKEVPPGVKELGPNPQAARACGEAMIEIADVAPGILLSGVFSRVCRVETGRPGTVGLYVQAQNRDKVKPFPKPIAVNLGCELPRELESCWQGREPWSRLDPPRNCISYENETARRAGLRAIGQCLINEAAPPPNPAFARLRDAEAGEARRP